MLFISLLNGVIAAPRYGDWRLLHCPVEVRYELEESHLDVTVIPFKAEQAEDKVPGNAQVVRQGLISSPISKRIII